MFGTGRLRATKRFRDWHRQKVIEVRVHDASKAPGPRLIGPDDYELLDAETGTLYRKGWERWPAVEARRVPPPSDIVLKLVEFQKSLGTVSGREAKTAV